MYYLCLVPNSIVQKMYFSIIGLQSINDNLLDKPNLAQAYSGVITTMLGTYIYVDVYGQCVASNIFPAALSMSSALPAVSVRSTSLSTQWLTSSSLPQPSPSSWCLERLHFTFTLAAKCDNCAA